MIKACAAILAVIMLLVLSTCLMASPPEGKGGPRCIGVCNEFQKDGRTVFLLITSDQNVYCNIVSSSGTRTGHRTLTSGVTIDKRGGRANLTLIELTMDDGGTITLEAGWNGTGDKLEKPLNFSADYGCLSGFAITGYMSISTAVCHVNGEVFNSPWHGEFFYYR